MVTFASAGSKLEFHGYTTDIIDANIFLDVSSFSVIMIVKKLNWSLLIISLVSTRVESLKLQF